MSQSARPLRHPPVYIATQGSQPIAECSGFTLGRSTPYPHEHRSQPTNHTGDNQMSHEISQFLMSLFPLLYLTVFGFIALLWALLLTTMLLGMTRVVLGNTQPTRAAYAVRHHHPSASQPSPTGASDSIHGFRCPTDSRPPCVTANRRFPEN